MKCQGKPRMRIEATGFALRTLRQALSQTIGNCKMALSKYLQPRSYVNKLSFFWDKLYHESKYDTEFVREVERRKFVDAGLDYNQGLAKLDQILDRLGKPAFEDQQGMASIHWMFSMSDRVGGRGISKHACLNEATPATGTGRTAKCGVMCTGAAYLCQRAIERV